MDSIFHIYNQQFDSFDHCATSDDTDDAFFVFLVDKLHTMYVEHTIPEVIMLDVLFRLKNEVTSSEAWEDLEYVHDMIPASVEEVKRIHNRDKSNPEAFLNEQNMDCERGKNGACIMDFFL